MLVSGGRRSSSKNPKCLSNLPMKTLTSGSPTLKRNERGWNEKRPTTLKRSKLILEALLLTEPAWEGRIAQWIAYLLRTQRPRVRLLVFPRFFRRNSNTTKKTEPALWYSYFFYLLLYLIFRGGKPKLIKMRLDTLDDYWFLEKGDTGYAKYWDLLSERDAIRKFHSLGTPFA